MSSLSSAFTLLPSMMRPYPWFSFTQSDRFSIGLDIRGNYLARIVSPCGCVTDVIFDIMAGPEMASDYTEDVPF